MKEATSGQLRDPADGWVDRQDGLLLLVRQTNLTTMTHCLTTPLRTHRVRLEAKALIACERTSRPVNGGVIPSLPTANSADRMRGA